MQKEKASQSEHEASSSPLCVDLVVEKVVSF